LSLTFVLIQIEDSSNHKRKNDEVEIKVTKDQHSIFSTVNKLFKKSDQIIAPYGRI